MSQPPNPSFPVSSADLSTGSPAADSLLCLHSPLMISSSPVALNTKYHPCDYNSQWCITVSDVVSQHQCCVANCPSIPTWCPTDSSAFTRPDVNPRSSPPRNLLHLHSVISSSVDCSFLFPGAQAKNLSIVQFLFCHNPYPIGNHGDSTFRLYLEPDHISPLPWLPLPG